MLGPGQTGSWQHMEVQHVDHIQGPIRKASPREGRAKFKIISLYNPYITAI